MQVGESSFQALVGGAKQFRVPLFQRPYTWGTREHEQLWNDILEQYQTECPDDQGPSSSTGSHFLGSFVLAPAPCAASLPTFLVVDGQQRLTTLFLLLCAIRETAGQADSEARARITELYLTNKFRKGMDRHRLVPTQADRDAFFACVDDAADKANGKNAINDAYRFYLARLAELGPDAEPLDLDVLETVIVAKLAIVDITAQQGDNVYRIFESLNATGVGLTQADLLRNYLFMLLPTRGEVAYEEAWLPMQNRVGAENLEGLARVDIQRRGDEVRNDDVYRAQQERLQPFEQDEARIEAEVRDLALRSRHYERILHPERESDPGVRSRLAFLHRWGAQTVHPVVMYLYERRENGEFSADVMEVALANVESFLVRRLLVGVSTANLHRIFLRLVRQLRQDSEQPVVDVLRYNLSTERKYWAADEELRSAVLTRPFYYYGRALQRRLILERLEESFGHKELGELKELKLSVEHIMPQSMTEDWRNELSQDGEDPDVVHDELLHTLGNLTLTAYNTELSNHPFERKKRIYEDSHLTLNAELSEPAAWTRSQMETRAERLINRALEIWPAPVPGATDSTEGFDWSRAHAAIAAIPAGRWTAYYDVAHLIGTSPIAVGNHIGANAALVNGHRVLTWDGKTSPGFHWSEPDDHREVRDVLEEEGIAFDAKGSASKEQHLGADELQALIATTELTADD